MIRYLIIGVCIILLISGALAGLIYAGYLTIPAQASPKAPEAESAANLDLGELVKLPPLILNLREERGRHYLKASIILEVGEKKLAESIQAKMSVFTDKALLIISEKSLAQVKENDFKESLKEELLRGFNELVAENGIRQIYFDEFLFQ